VEEFVWRKDADPTPIPKASPLSPLQGARGTSGAGNNTRPMCIRPEGAKDLFHIENSKFFCPYRA